MGKRLVIEFIYFVFQIHHWQILLFYNFLSQRVYLLFLLEISVAYFNTLVKVQSGLKFIPKLDAFLIFLMVHFFYSVLVDEETLVVPVVMRLQKFVVPNLKRPPFVHVSEIGVKLLFIA